MPFVELICPVCEKKFERERWYINKKKKQGANLFCSKSCCSKYCNTRRYPKRELICENCGKKLILSESDRKEKYCSQECYKEHQKDRLAEQCRRIGKECAEKISKTKKEKFESGELVHPWIGKNHTQKTKNKISKARNKYYETHDGYWKGKKLSEESKEKMSETRTRKWINGEYDHIKKSWAKGKHYSKKSGRKMVYRSSWELAYMKYLDQNDNVISYDSECLRIPYYDINKHIRHYIPDFVVQYKTGKYIEEIKPQCFRETVTNKNKYKSARQYCKENNIKFRVLTENYLKRLKVI